MALAHRVILVLAIMLSLAACASGGPLTSRYFKPEEGVLYRYGAFCGPGHPSFLQAGDFGQLNRLARLRALPAVDDLDRGCKAHDLCYEMSGGPTFQCDNLFAAYMSPTPYDDLKCSALANEMEIAMLAAQASSNMARSGSRSLGAAQATASVAMAPLNGSLQAMTVMMAGGFPEQPGTCFMEPDSGVVTSTARSTANRAAPEEATRTSLRAVLPVGMKTAALAAACPDLSEEARRADTGCRARAAQLFERAFPEGVLPAMDRGASRPTAQASSPR